MMRQWVGVSAGPGVSLSASCHACSTRPVAGEPPPSAEVGGPLQHRLASTLYVLSPPVQCRERPPSDSTVMHKVPWGKECPVVVQW